VRAVSRTGVVVVVVGIGVLGMMWVAGGCGGGDDDDAGDAGTASATTTTMVTGGIDIETPDGWMPIPVPVLGFGLAVPPGWEATRLDEEGLSSTGQAEPVVPGFVAAAHRAAQSGAVFYAAGVDGDGRVTDLKVRAILDSGVTDAAALETLASQVAADAGVTSPQVEVVSDATLPTVDVRFRAQAQRTADEDPSSTVDVTVDGTERLVLSPSGVVYSMVVTSEDAGTHDDLAPQLLDTLAFPPAS
jgi:hypothetical protein